MIINQIELHKYLLYLQMETGQGITMKNFLKPYLEYIECYAAC